MEPAENVDHFIAIPINKNNKEHQFTIDLNINIDKQLKAVYDVTLTGANHMIITNMKDFNYITI